jgi:hypothetical protein
MQCTRKRRSSSTRITTSGKSGITYIYGLGLYGTIISFYNRYAKTWYHNPPFPYTYKPILQLQTSSNSPLTHKSISQYIPHPSHTSLLTLIYPTPALQSDPYSPLYLPPHLRLSRLQNQNQPHTQPSQQPTSKEPYHPQHPPLPQGSN